MTLAMNKPRAIAMTAMMTTERSPTGTAVDKNKVMTTVYSGTFLRGNSRDHPYFCHKRISSILKSTL
jgi:hypothetical protein